MRAFDSYHPLVIFTYFLSVILFSMFFMHPIFLGISLFVSILYLGVLRGWQNIKKTMLFTVPVFLIIAISNPIFNHKGVTPLFYVNYNPITLEAVIYGLAMATMIVTVIIWFASYNEVMTSDKFIALFGMVSPNIALLIAMTLNTVPKMKNQAGIIADSQKTMGMYITSGSLMKRARSSVRILSILITWALENAIDTADSMKARGYGLKGRSSYSLFKFRKRDTLLLTTIVLLSAICIYGDIAGFVSFTFYPYISPVDFSIRGLALYLAYFSLLTIPLIIQLKEAIQWRLSISKI